MDEVCAAVAGKARKAHANVLRVLGIGGKQGAIAAAMGVSDTTVSRIKTDQLEGAISLLYCAGFKVVPSNLKCFPEQDVEAWYAAYKRDVDRAATAAQLFEDLE